jgi:hypothetical protein
MQLNFSGPLTEWRGPAPYYFVAVPPESAAQIREAARLLSYGWGAVPVRVQVGETTWTTSLFPRQGTYLVPVRDAVRRAEGLEMGAEVTLTLGLG